ncbi:MAG: RNA pseudouridine synthase [Lachnospiraceae bacterium]|nr:RNA pseudouridine synthase [Lachnospiraceae bacterium]
MSLKAEIRYENEKVIVIYKPAGLPVQTARASQEDVCSQLKNHLKGGYLGVIHRLDQPVEGLLVFARDSKTAAGLTADLQSGRLKKSYIAVVYGTVTEGGIDVCCMRKTADGVCEIGEGEDYKKAELSYEVMGSMDGTSLLRIDIRTGRFHQIRAQMAHLGFPLLGDMKYGSAESLKYSQEHGIQLPALCADRLMFTDPADRETVRFECKPENPAFKPYEQIIF